MEKMKITESQLQEIILEEVKKELEEGWLNNAWNSVKGGLKGAGRGYQQASLMGTDDANIMQLPDMSRFDRGIAAIANVNDAATMYRKLMTLASKYAKDAKALRTKTREIGANHNIERIQNRQGRRLAAGYNTNDVSKGAGFAPNLKGNSSSQERAKNLQQTNLNFQPQGYNFSANLEEAVSKAIEETLLEEGLWSNLKGAWQGMKQGAQMGKALGTDAKADYASGYERTKNWDPYTKKQDAKSSVEKYAEMAKNYDAVAAQLREKAKALAVKWNIVRNNVGQAGPAQYGYRKQPQAQPAPAPINEATVKRIVAEAIEKMLREE